MDYDAFGSLTRSMNISCTTTGTHQHRSLDGMDTSHDDNLWILEKKPTADWMAVGYVIAPKKLTSPSEGPRFSNGLRPHPSQEACIAALNLPLSYYRTSGPVREE